MYRVLLIDDNKLIGDIVCQYLCRFGFEVDYSGSPFGVINKVKQFKPDVVLLDINIPGLRGDKLAKLLRDNKEKLCDFCLISFSSEDEETQRELVDRSLVDGYILKTNRVDGLDLKIKEIKSTACVATA